MQRPFFLLFLCISVHGTGQVNLERGLRAYYPFFGNARDASGRNNNPAFNNATLTADRFGNANSAYHFNGRNSYMRIPNSPSLNCGRTMSLSAWIRPMGFYRGVCHGNAVMMKGDADYLAGNYSLRFDDNAYTNGGNCSTPNVDVAHQVFFGQGIYFPSRNNLPWIKLNQWYHLIITYDGNRASMYLDCKLISNVPQGNISFTNSYDLFLGRLNSPNFPYWFNGDLDEVRIYDRVLNKSEIMALCNTKAEPRESVAKIKKTVSPPLATPKKNNPKPAVTVPAEADSIRVNPIINDPARDSNTFVPEKRNTELVREIVVDHDSVSVTLYDNGEIDGDSVTLIYNDSVLTTRQLLTAKPLTFIIEIKPGSLNELVMYAENLGSIPPNTALMIINDGDKRYELNIKSTKSSNGMVRFKLRE